MINLKKIILIPVYNDWKSLNFLLKKLDDNLKKKIDKINILILNDNSSEKIKISHKKLVSIKKIEVLTIPKNVGSQRAIALGLLYLKKLKDDFIVTVMDSDGEDDPSQVPKMLRLASRHPNFVITSNRKNRKESKMIIFLYKIHLILTFTFSLKWISFGNFSSFHKKNISHLFIDNSPHFAHSSAVIKNCLIKRVYAKRKRRYFDKSKLSLISLIEHSIRVNAVFFKSILISSTIYIFIALLTLPKIFTLIILSMIFIFIFLVIIIKIRFHKIKIYKMSKKIIK